MGWRAGKSSVEHVVEVRKLNDNMMWHMGVGYVWKVGINIRTFPLVFHTNHWWLRGVWIRCSTVYIHRIQFTLGNSAGTIMLRPLYGCLGDSIKLQLL